MFRFCITEANEEGSRIYYHAFSMGIRGGAKVDGKCWKVRRNWSKVAAEVTVRERGKKIKGSPAGKIGAGLLGNSAPSFHLFAK